MAKLKIKAPDGKTLVIDAGNDPSKYDSVVDDVMKDYTGKDKNSMLPLPSDVINEPGVFSQTIPSKAFEKGGEFVAENLGEKGHPLTGAILGTGIQMIPDIGSSLIPGFKAKAISKPLEAGLEIGKTAISKIKQPTAEVASQLAQAAEMRFIPTAEQKASQLGEHILFKQESKITKLRNLIEKISKSQDNKLKELQKLESSSKGALEASEKSMGVSFKPSPSFEKLRQSPEFLSKLTERFGRQFGEKTPEEISQIISPERIQTYRKFGQEGTTRVSGPLRARLQQMREKAANALESVSNEFSEARSRFKDVKDVLKDLPIETKRKLKGVADQIKNEKQVYMNLKKETTDLIKIAKKADLEELSRIKEEGANLIKQGIERDELAKKIKQSIIAALSIAGGAIGVKKIF